MEIKGAVIVTQTGEEIQEILNQAPKDTRSIEDINALIPGEASAENQLADKAHVAAAVKVEKDRAEAAEQRLQQGIDTVDSKVTTEKARAEGVEQGLDSRLTKAESDIDTVDSKVATEKARAEGAEQTLQTNIDTVDGKVATEKARAEGVEQGLNIRLTQAEGDIDGIEAVIPSQATPQNQLADKEFVNHSVATNTANFVGTFQTLAELQAVQNPTNNDYGFVIEQDAQGNEYYDRYKYNAANATWLFEYKIESTPFTAAQWAAIQSGITAALVTKLQDLPTNAALQGALNLINTTLSGKQDTIADLAAIRSGAAAGATALQQSVNVTYAELVALKAAGALKAGQYYRITDYVTTVGENIDEQTGRQMTRSAGHPFDVIVRADSVSTLSETAYAALHDGDTYFQNARLEAWQLKYTLDNDSNHYDWADTEQGKGVIYEMQDEWGNRLPYDFKNVQFLRFPIMGQNHLYVNSDYPTEMDDDGYVTDVIGARLTFNVANPTDQQRLNNLGKYLHSFMGYYSEQYIYDDGYTDSWGGLEMEDGGSRMFACVTDNYESYGILAEVDPSKAVWCHTLGILTAFTSGETTDRSMTGKVTDFHLSPYIYGDKKTGLHMSVHVNYQTGTTIRNSRITGYFFGNTLSGYIERSSISGSLDYVDFKAYAYYVQFPALSHCMVVSNLPEGNGWDDMQEVDFSGEDYEQIITRNDQDEIVVRPLYSI